MNPPPIPTYPARPINGGPLDVALAKHGDWRYEPKYNGWRALVHIATGAMFNRHGQRLTIEGEFKPALEQLRGTLDAEAFQWADCEALERRHNIGRGSLIVLDVIPEASHRAAAYLERRRWLEAVLEMPTLSVPPEDNQVALVPSDYASDALWMFTRRANVTLGCAFYEGVVAKRADKPYPIQLLSAGREFPFWMKHRWTF